MSVHHLTEADVNKRALEHPCPGCGARAGVRCRILTPGSHRTKVDVKRNPCPDRARLAWREMLAEQV